LPLTALIGRRRIRCGFAAFLILAPLLSVTAADATAQSADPAQLERGAYLFIAADCQACHTDVKNKGALMAGGRALKTPFGIFYSPNITADPETGIGGWSDEDFIRALREGVSPDGDYYFPVFPYTSYTKMTDQDIRDLKAYLFSLPTVTQANKEHEVDFPYGWRFTLGPWQWMNFTVGAFEPDAGKSGLWNRGAYLVQALGHCGECHTPRGWLGGTDGDYALSGTPDGPEGDKVPNITPHAETGIGGWERADILRVLATGMLPDGDYVGSGMGEVVDFSTSKLTPEDRDAIVEYLLSLPPIENTEAKATRPGSAWE
jgi:mono/diheme cytochrome c family protein